MLKTQEEKDICKQYSSHDKNGRVHCDECPLNLAVELEGELGCKATHTFDEEINEWVPDEYDIHNESEYEE